MAVSSVSLNEMLRPWYNAGVTHFWPDPDAPELDPEIAALLRPGASAVPGVAADRPVSPERNAAVPPRESDRVAASRPAETRPNEPRRSDPRASAARPAAPQQAVSRPAPARVPLSPARQALAGRTVAAPLLWTYPELGIDLGGKGDPGRSVCLRTLIGSLRLPKGTSCFWPLSLPGETPEEAQAQFLAGLDHLSPRAVILLGADAIPMSGLDLALPTPFTQTLHAGRLFLLLPDMARLIAEPGLCAPCADFLSAQFIGLPGVVAGGRG